MARKKSEEVKSPRVGTRELAPLLLRTLDTPPVGRRDTEKELPAPPTHNIVGIPSLQLLHVLAWRIDLRQHGVPIREGSKA